MFKLLCVLVLAVCVSALDNGLARTPPMGWLSWQRFRCNTDCTNHPKSCISEKLYMDMADRMAADGYRDAGYEYVNIDDCWASGRDDNLKLVADPSRFPSGMKALADYVHSKGLKLGTYGDMGTTTCAGYPGSKFTMQLDANTFAEWGIDSFKMDGCNSDTSDFPTAYPLMAKFLNMTGRPILFSCSWPAYENIADQTKDYPSIAQHCNIWRNYLDIDDTWDSVTGIMHFFGDNKGNFSKVAGPGNFNDPDMIVVGNPGLSYSQEKAQMAIWSILAAPLLLSADLRIINDQSKALLLNKNVIAINQDPLGIMGARVWTQAAISIWTRPVSPAGSFAVALLNENSGGYPYFLNVPLNVVIGTTAANAKYQMTEIFDGTDLGTVSNASNFQASVDISSVFFVKLTPVS